MRARRTKSNGTQPSSGISDNETLGLIEAIYDASTAPEKWPEVIGRITTHLHFEQCALLWGNHAVRGQLNMFTHGWDPKALADYTSHYATLNHFAYSPRRKPEGIVYKTEDLVPRSAMFGDAYCEEFMMPQKLDSNIGVDLFKDRQILGVFEAQRPYVKGAASDREIQTLQLLAPHLQRACLIAYRLSQAGAVKSGVLSTLDQLAFGVALLDENIRVLHVNPEAERLLRSCPSLAFKGGVLAVRDADENQALWRLMRDAADTGAGRGLSTGVAMSIACGEGAAPLAVSVTPIQVKALRPDLPHGRVCAAVFLRDPNHVPPNLTGLLAALYELTPAEARLATRLGAGETLDEVAAALKLSRETLRVQLRSVFDKTGVHRQVDLVRLTMSHSAFTTRTMEA